MRNSKFFTLFGTLTVDQVAAFYKYIRQVHSGDKVALQVFDYARKLYPGFEDEKKMDIEYAYRKLFSAGDHENPRKKLLDALSDLHLWLKGFLIARRLDRKPSEAKMLWLDILQEQNLQEEYSKQLTSFYQKIKNAPKKDEKMYLLEMAVGYAHYQHLSLLSNTKPNIQALQQSLDDLEACAEIIRVRLACQLANTKKVRTSKSAAESAFPAWRPPEARIIENSPLLALYCNIYQLIETEEAAYYQQIEKVFKENELHLDELGAALSYLHNYTATQIRNGTENDIIKRVHELNQIGFTNGLFDQPENLRFAQFINIISLACSAGDYAWATEFMEDRQVVLPEKTREHTVLLARATIAFAKEDFKQVLEMLKTVEFKGPFDIIRSKLLILKSYLELDHADADDVCHKFEAWLSQRPAKTEAVEAALASVRIIKMLISKKEKKEKIQSRFESVPVLYSPSWLQEKIRTYKTQYPK